MWPILGVLWFLSTGSGTAAPSTDADDAAMIIFNADGGVVEDVRIAQASSGRTYLLAVWAASPDHEPRVVLYSSFAGGFIRVMEQATAFASVEHLELIDLNNDGTPEAFWQINSFGNARGAVSYNVLAVEQGSQCGAVLDYAHGVPSNDIAWVCGTSLHMPEARTFIEERIGLDPRFARADAEGVDAQGPEQVVRLWRSRYLGFAEGLRDEATLEPYELPLDSSAHAFINNAFATASVGSIQLISQFKGAVYAVDQERAVYWVVLSPPFPHDWITTITVRGECFILDDDSASSGPPITYHPTRNQLTRGPDEACETITAPPSGADTSLQVPTSWPPLLASRWEGSSTILEHPLCAVIRCRFSHSEPMTIGGTVFWTDFYFDLGALDGVQLGLTVRGPSHVNRDVIISIGLRIADANRHPIDAVSEFANRLLNVESRGAVTLDTMQACVNEPDVGRDVDTLTTRQIAGYGVNCALTATDAMTGRRLPAPTFLLDLLMPDRQ